MTDAGNGLAAFNRLPADRARAELLSCCASQAWADRMLAARPYHSLDEVVALNDRTVAALNGAEFGDALAGHPRIGERAAESDGRDWSSQEQAGVSGAADANRDYERRFGHVYLVSASRRTADEMLTLIHRRLGNDPATEWAGRPRGAHEDQPDPADEAVGGCMNSLSTHVLDATTGRPAAEMPVRLERSDGDVVAEACTDTDGRVAKLTTGLDAGEYRLVFDTGSYFPDAVYPQVVVTFTVTGPEQHYHVPLLLSPFAYSTYRGS